MKRLFILLIAAAAAVFAGCAPEPIEVSETPEPPVTSGTTTTITTTAEPLVATETEQENQIETYEYKGITFEGRYSSGTYPGGREYHDFHINKDSLYQGEGFSLYLTSFRAALSFIANNTEKLLKDFTDDEERIEKQLNEMGDIPNRLNNLDYFTLQSAVISDDNNEFIYVTYIYHLDNWYSNLYVFMEVYLNDDGEWKIASINHAN